MRHDLMNLVAITIISIVAYTTSAHAINATDTRMVVCKDSNGNTVDDSYCTTAKPETTRVGQSCEVPVAGECGSANGVAAIGAPTANLCSKGTAGQFSTDGRSWVCQGTGGGANSSTCAARSLMAGCRVETLGYDELGVVASQSGEARCRTNGYNVNDGQSTRINNDPANEQVYFFVGSDYFNSHPDYGQADGLVFSGSEGSRFTISWSGEGTRFCDVNSSANDAQTNCRRTEAGIDNGEHTAMATIQDAVTGNSTTFTFKANKDTAVCTPGATGCGIQN